MLSGFAPLRPDGAPPEPYRWSEVLAAWPMEVVRHELTMVRSELSDAVALPLPVELEVRPVEPGQLRAIWQAHATAFLDHPGAERNFYVQLSTAVGASLNPCVGNLCVVTIPAVSLRRANRPRLAISA